MKKALAILLLLTVLLCGCGWSFPDEPVSQASTISGYVAISLPAASSGVDSAAVSSRVTSTAPVSSEVSSPESPSEPVSSEAPAQPLTVSVTVPEGYSLTQIFTLLEEKGVCAFDDLMEAAQTGDFSDYPLIAALEADDSRCFLLEGYLFPDTYEFYLNQKPKSVIATFLRNTERRFDEDLRAEAAQSGFTPDQILTLASVIQKEAGSEKEMKNISAVLHNRLRIDMKLQCDPTINYVERYLKPYLDGDVNRYNAYYNTYKCRGLPAGPICNPGLAAIRAAMRPSDIDAIYFITDDAGIYHYASDYEEHLANCRAAGYDVG